jgi:hypothetical protein
MNMTLLCSQNQKAPRAGMGSAIVTKSSFVFFFIPLCTFYFDCFFSRENVIKQKEIASLESQVYRLVELVGVSIRGKSHCVQINKELEYIFSMLFST